MCECIQRSLSTSVFAMDWVKVCAEISYKHSWGAEEMLKSADKFEWHESGQLFQQKMFEPKNLYCTVAIERERDHYRKSWTIMKIRNMVLRWNISLRNDLKRWFLQWKDALFHKCQQTFGQYQTSNACCEFHCFYVNS